MFNEIRELSENLSLTKLYMLKGTKKYLIISAYKALIIISTELFKINFFIIILMCKLSCSWTDVESPGLVPSTPPIITH